MKRTYLAILGAALLLFSLASCGGKPSDEKIKAALEEGMITAEDAKEKGWIDDAWIEKNFTSIEAGTKIHVFEEFETTYLDGTPASSKIIAGKMCLVFFDTTQEDTMKKLAIVEKASASMKQLGIPMLGIIMDEKPEEARKKLETMSFPVIVYNEKMQESLGGYGNILATDVVYVFTKEGGFYSAWNTNVEEKELVNFAKVIADEE